MTDIEPWLDGDAPADVADWLGAARRERPRDDVIERCAVLVAAGGVGLAAAAAAKPLAGGSSLVGSSTVGGVLVKWGVGGVLAGTLFATGAHFVGVANTPTVPSAAPRSSSVSVPAAPVGVPVSPAPELRNAESEPILPDEPPRAQTSAGSPSTKPATEASKNASPDQHLAEELALIDRVRASVDAKNPALARTLLAQHERRFGKSAQFAPEARYLRLEVAAATANIEEARRLAHEILERDPSGPHAARARALLKESDPDGELRR